MRFIVTKELGRLAKWLRLLGYDTVYSNSDEKGPLLLQSLREDRIILTRSIKRLGSHKGTKTVYIRVDDVKEQIKQLINELKLSITKETMFTKCAVCNELLNPIEKQEVKDKVPEFVFETQERFMFCAICSRIYWHGTHWGNAEKFLQEAMG